MKFAAPAVVLVVLLVGCTPVASPSITPTPTSSSMAEPSASPTDAAPEATDPSTWLVETIAVGPIALGDPIVDAAAALTTYTRGDTLANCPAIFLDADGLPGIVLSPDTDGAIDSITITAKSAGMPQDPTVLAGVSPKTPEGVGIGSTESDLLTSYPEAQVVRDDPGSKVYRIGANGAFRLFLIESQLVTSITVSYSDQLAREFC